MAWSARACAASGAMGCLCLAIIYSTLHDETVLLSTQPAHVSTEEAMQRIQAMLSRATNTARAPAPLEPRAAPLVCRPLTTQQKWMAALTGRAPKRDCRTAPEANTDSVDHLLGAMFADEPSRPTHLPQTVLTGHFTPIISESKKLSDLRALDATTARAASWLEGVFSPLHSPKPQSPLKPLSPPAAITVPFERQPAERAPAAPALPAAPPPRLPAAKKAAIELPARSDTHAVHAGENAEAGEQQVAKKKTANSRTPASRAESHAESTSEQASNLAASQTKQHEHLVAPLESPASPALSPHNTLAATLAGNETRKRAVVVAGVDGARHATADTHAISGSHRSTYDLSCVCLCKHLRSRIR